MDTTNYLAALTHDGCTPWLDPDWPVGLLTHVYQQARRGAEDAPTWTLPLNWGGDPLVLQ